MVEFNYKRDDRVRFTFGRYRSRPVRDVAQEDPQYLRWVVLNMGMIDNAILKEIYECLEDEGAFDVDDLKEEREYIFGPAGYRQRKSDKWNDYFNDSAKATYTTKKTEDKNGYTKTLVDSVVLKAYRDAAKKWHPDLCKGSSEPMKAINDFYEKLKEGLSRL